MPIVLQSTAIVISIMQYIIYVQVSSNAIAICSRVGQKPSPAAAQELKKLFTASTSVPVPKKRAVFDPTAECVFASEKKKKKAARNRGSIVNFVLITEHEKGLLRGNSRKQLLQGSSAKKIEIFRSMSPQQIQAKVLQQFTTLSTISFLQVAGGSHLVCSPQQNPDGNEVIANSQKRSGNTLYITGQIKSKGVCGYHK